MQEANNIEEKNLINKNDKNGPKKKSIIFGANQHLWIFQTGQPKMSQSEEFYNVIYERMLLPFTLIIVFVVLHEAPCETPVCKTRNSDATICE